MVKCRSGFSFEDPLPAEVTYQCLSTGLYSASHSNGVLTGQIYDILPGETKDIHYTVRVTTQDVIAPEGRILENTATVHLHGVPDETASGFVFLSDKYVDFNVVKSVELPDGMDPDQRQYFQTGNEFTYRIAVRNPRAYSHAIPSYVQVIDSLPEEVEYLSSSSNNPSCVLSYDGASHSLIATVPGASPVVDVLVNVRFVADSPIHGIFPFVNMVEVTS